jgi:hypothetical protein
MQWPGFFAGHIQLNDKEFAAINPGYGFLWLPPNQWGKAIQWWIYYLLLLVISAIIVGHFSVSQIALFLGGAGLAR